MEAVVSETVAAPATQPNTLCSHCKSAQANLGLNTFRQYCNACWADINKRKSESMKAKNMKRSNATRAAMSASKHIKKGPDGTPADPEKWKLFYNFYLEQLEKEEKLKTDTSA